MYVTVRRTYRSNGVYSFTVFYKKNVKLADNWSGVAPHNRSNDGQRPAYTHLCGVRAGLAGAGLVWNRSDLGPEIRWSYG